MIKYVEWSIKYLFFVLFPVLCKVFIIIHNNWLRVVVVVLIFLAIDKFVNLFCRGFSLKFLKFANRDLDVRTYSVNLSHSASEFIVEYQEHKWDQKHVNFVLEHKQELLDQFKATPLSFFNHFNRILYYLVCHIEMVLQGLWKIFIFLDLWVSAICNSDFIYRCCKDNQEEEFDQMLKHEFHWEFYE